MSGKIEVSVGSRKEAKMHSVNEVFDGQFAGNTIVTKGINAESGVLPQPNTREMTIQGAVNRASNTLLETGGSFAVGLEGGIYFDKEGKLWVFDVAAIMLSVEGNPVFVGESDPVCMPDAFLPFYEEGRYLSDCLFDYLKATEAEKWPALTREEIQTLGSSYYVKKERISRDQCQQQALARAIDRFEAKYITGIDTEYRL